MKQRGYDIVHTRNDLLDIPGWRPARVFGVFRDGDLDYADIAEHDSSQPSLAELTRRAIQLLQYNPKGYFLVIDAGLIAKASAANEGERTLREIAELDRAVATALSYAGNDALIVVTGKQSLGGLRMNGYPFKNDRGMAVIGTNPQNIPSITWSTGPGGSPSGDAVSPDQPPKPTEPAAVIAPAGIGVAEDIIAVSAGPGSEKLQGFKDNTDVFKVLSENF
jgi:alkaline phosphatase